jgi:release factor glutamine methyltransferase
MPKPLPPKDPDWTILKLLQWTTAYFNSLDIEGSRSAAEILLAHALGLERVELYLRYDQPLSRQELGSFKVLVRRRIRREPVAYILGRREFWSMELAVTTDVLIPRPETECLVERALAELADSACNRVLELGTGSGAIVLALASRRPRDLFFASDVSPAALRVARYNAREHGLAERIGFFCGDWLAPLAGRIDALDMVISNPPYIPRRQIATLEPEIRCYEPLLALDGEEDGLGSLRRIVRAAHRSLKPGGRLLLEIGCDQKTALEGIVAEGGHYAGLRFFRDYGGNERVARMQKCS